MNQYRPTPILVKSPDTLFGKKCVYKNTKTGKYHKWLNNNLIEVDNINDAYLYYDNSLLGGHNEYKRVEYDKEFKALRKSKLEKLSL